MKKFIAVALLIVMIATLCVGCGDPLKKVEKKIEGTWTADIVVGNYQLTAVYVFEDGRVSCTPTLMGTQMDTNVGSYTVQEGAIHLSYDNGTEADLEYTFENNKLRIFMSDDVELIKE